MLWPLGGIAYVQPPQRPGATLWSIAAGPLVNVLLVPILFLLGMLLGFFGAIDTTPNVMHLLRNVLWINIGLLIFNLLPLYPLDGGQIVRSLLWFVVGRGWSLTIATVLGFAGVAALGLLALAEQRPWLGVVAVFMLLNCWNGLSYAVKLIRAARAPRREGRLCPVCGSAPPVGAFWVCPRCRKSFDLFEAKPSVPSAPRSVPAHAAWNAEGIAPSSPGPCPPNPGPIPRRPLSEGDSVR